MTLLARSKYPAITCSNYAPSLRPCRPLPSFLGVGVLLTVIRLEARRIWNVSLVDGLKVVAECPTKSIGGSAAHRGADSGTYDRDELRRLAGKLAGDHADADSGGNLLDALG